jgi:hypothetical protein
MSVPALIERLDDFINPIVVKELRQAVKSWLVIGVLLLFLGLQVLVIALTLVFREARAVDGIDWRTGNDLFQMIQGILLGTCMVLIPSYAAIRLSVERSDTNVDLLFISTLRPSSIIAGKFFSALVLAMLVYSACAPFMTFTYLLRGIDIPTILLILGIDLVVMVLVTQIGLFLASVPMHLVVKFVIAFFGMILLLYNFAYLVAGCSALIQHGIPDPEEFWPIMGLLTLFVLAITAQLFCWSVALISAPSANRAVAGRVCLVCTWLLLGLAITGYVLWTLRGGLPRHDPVIVWLVLGVVMFCLQIVISINERDSWGTRVARTIPRWRLLRPIAFLFYSGAGGGVLLAGLGLAATAVAGLLWWWYFVELSAGVSSPLTHEYDALQEAGRFLAGLVLFVWCYSLSAVLVRTYLLGDERLRSGYTWLIGLLLVGLGSALPSFAAFLIYYDEPYAQHNVLPWWNLTNPFGALYDLNISSRSVLHGGDVGFDVLLFIFLGLWAVLVTALALPWFIGQMMRFHPPAPRPPRSLPREVIIDAEVVAPAGEAR